MGSARSSCSASREARRPLPSHDRRRAAKASFGSPFFRLPFAYLIGMNVFGLVSVLTLVLGSVLKIVPAFGLVGLVGGITLGVLAGWRTDKALKRFFHD
jgi:ABC-type dipeptide/oligopeptide/nickel transport system permease subunit